METHAAPEPGVAALTTMREDLITIGLATWMILGLMVDAYFHSPDADLETFLTPWHGLFYSGFISTALWLNRITIARRRPTGNILTWAPPGYRLALIANGMYSRWMLASGTPLVLWSAFFVTVGRDSRGLQWPPEIWGGTIFIAVLTGLALHLLLNAGGQLAIAPTNRRDSPANTSPAGT